MQWSWNNSDWCTKCNDKPDRSNHDNDNDNDNDYCLCEDNVSYP